MEQKKCSKKEQELEIMCSIGCIDKTFVSFLLYKIQCMLKRVIKVDFVVFYKIYIYINETQHGKIYNMYIKITYILIYIIIIIII